MWIVLVSSAVMGSVPQTMRVHDETFLEHDRMVQLSLLYDRYPHLIPAPDSDLARATTLPLLNGFGQSIAFSPNLASPTLTVTGYGYQYNPDATPSSTSLTANQTAFAMLCIARYNYVTEQLDQTFNPLARGINGIPGKGARGQVITKFGSSTFPLRVVIQPDLLLPHQVTRQKILIIGYRYLVTGNANTNVYQIFVARYNWDGSLDTTYNANGPTPGIASTPVSVIPSNTNLIAGISDIAYDAALQPDNKLVVVGTATGQLFALRYKTDGTLDTTFNPSGFTYNFNTVPVLKTPGGTTPGVFVCSILSKRTVNNAGLSIVGYDNAYGVAIQPDGKIVIAGTGSSFVSPLNSSALDGSQLAASVLDGSGTNLIGATGRNQVILLRLTATGVPDTTFGKQLNNLASSGVQVTTVAGFDDAGYAVALQPDGKILVAGSMGDGFGNYFMTLIRYTAQGIVDTSFGPTQVLNTLKGVIRLQGKQVLPVAESPFALANMVVLQPDNKILISGYNTYNASTPRFTMTVARYLPTGVLDKTFNPSGIPQGFSPPNASIPIGYNLPVQRGVQTISIQGIYDKSFGMALQPGVGGRIILVGCSYDKDPLQQLYAFAAAILSSTGAVQTITTGSFTNS